MLSMMDDDGSGPPQTDQSSPPDPSSPPAVVRESVRLASGVAQVKAKLDVLALRLGMSRSGDNRYSIALSPTATMSVDLFDDAGTTRVVLSRPAHDPEGLGALRAASVRGLLRDASAASGAAPIASTTATTIGSAEPAPPVPAASSSSKPTKPPPKKR